jgi:hypothetical protein
MEVVRITDLADDSTSMISHRQFQDVEIRGPAVLALLGGVSLVSCGFDGTFESIIIIVPDGSTKVGVIGLSQVSFLRCRFRNVALIGTEELAQTFGQQLLKHDE